MNRKRGYLYILLAAMIYSTTEVALKGLGGVFAPMQITVERVLIGALFLLPFALRSLRRNAIRLTRSDWSYFALLGFLTVTLHMSLLQMAVLHMDASATSIIYSGNPVFALAAAHLILHEPLKRNHLIAIGVELIGILFILNPAKLEVSPRGFAEILTATVLFAMYGTLCKLRIPRLGGLVITTFNMVLGGLELLALGTWMYMRSALGAGPRDALMVALARKTGRSAGVCRICADILVTVSGFLLGGQFGIGTVISALGLGSLINLNFSLLHFRPAQVHQENIAETLRYLRS